MPNRFVHLAANAAIVGALVHVVGAVVQAAVPKDPGEPGFALANALAGTAHLTFLLVALALGTSGAAGKGPLARIGVGIAVLGWGMLVTGEVLAQILLTILAPLFNAAGPVIGLGMTITGVAVLREHVWQGPQRLIPLLCGLYPLLVMAPVFTATGGPNYYIIAGWGLFWLLLAITLRLPLFQEDAQPNPPGLMPGHATPTRSSAPSRQPLSPEP